MHKPEKTIPLKDNNLALSVKGAMYILSQQLLSRMLTFGMNVFLIRISTLSTMGIVFDMELYSATILFLSVHHANSRGKVFEWPCCEIRPKTHNNYQ
jgi:Rft protein